MRSFPAVLIFMLLFPAWSFASYDYINISNPFLRKIPIAVPVFKAETAASGESAIAVEAADLVAETLMFTGYFKAIDRMAFLEQPHETGVRLSDLDFKNWRDIGAELLVTGDFSLENEIISYELRLFDVFQGKMVVGKRYKGRQEDQRRIIRRFCGEIMEWLTGNRGVFESRLAFVSTGSGSKEIYICDFDGHNPERYTTHKSISLSPAWSWDGQWLAYTSFVDGKPDLYIRHIRENRGVVFSREGINISPAWVPGRFALAATLSFSGEQDIYMLTGSGKIVKRLVGGWGIDVSPTFSPDGEKMAFVSNRAGSAQIYTQEISSGRIQRLTFEGGYNTTPEWSPVGNRIAFSSFQNNQFDIKVVNVDTGEVIQLTENQGDNESPTWSPDGSLIAFCSTREGAVPRIYVMTSAGTDQRRLLTMPGEQTNPAWSRGPITGQ